MKMEHTESSKTLAYKIQMPGNYPEESIQHSEHGGSFKPRIIHHLHVLNRLTIHHQEVVYSIWYFSCIYVN